MMRSRFDEQLERLNTELIEMGAFCEGAIANSVKALTENDMSLAKKAIEIEKEIDRKERGIESLCLKILLHQQPVASDLRQVSAALKIITDMERIGDQAADISEIILVGQVKNESGATHVSDMARATIKMVRDSILAYVDRSVELAQAVIDYDDVVDDLFDKVKSDVVSLIRQDIQKSENAIDILMIAKYFERIGDHATNIAEWVEFSITGIHKGESTL